MQTLLQNLVSHAVQTSVSCLNWTPCSTSIAIISPGVRNYLMTLTHVSSLGIQSIVSIMLKGEIIPRHYHLSFNDEYVEGQGSKWCQLNKCSLFCYDTGYIFQHRS